MEPDIKKEFEQFWQSLEQKVKVTFFYACIRFSMRCLLADIDENVNLSEYVFYRTDIWPNKFQEIELQDIQNKFPMSILVKHTLGNMYECMSQWYKIYIIPATSGQLARNILNKKATTVRSTVGAAQTIETKKKYDKKLKNEIA